MGEVATAGRWGGDGLLRVGVNPRRQKAETASQQMGERGLAAFFPAFFPALFPAFLSCIVQQRQLVVRRLVAGGR